MYRREASVDITAAFVWYEARSVGLGRDFQRAVHAVGIVIETFPEAFPIAFADVRRALTARFPYVVYYRAFDAQTMEVVACLHSRQDPDLARARMSDA